MKISKLKNATPINAVRVVVKPNLYPKNKEFGKEFKSKDGIKTYYEFYKGKKTPIIFLHGLSANLTNWHSLYQHLNKLGYPCILIDIRGHGNSTSEGPDSLFTIQKASLDLLQILKKHKIKKVIIISHCFGAMVALNFAKNHAIMIKKLILQSPEYYPKGSRKLNFFVPLFIKMIKVARPAWKSRAKLNMPVKLTNTKGRTDVDLFTFNDIRHMDPKILEKLFSEFITFDARNYIQKLKMPILVMHGKKDNIFHYKRVIASKTQNMKIVLLDGVNHHITINAQEKVRNEIQNFLAE